MKNIAYIYIINIKEIFFNNLYKYLEILIEININY